MSARRPLRLPEPDGLVAGVVLAAANVLGVGAAACATGAVPAVPVAPTVPDVLSATALDEARSGAGR
ncbi:hypothetical protein [Streptomyces sp. CNQ085]|uniref:hypothetical protein n=1 Tax=Streptomyces sp. CNQ085 TaxID=2886944 RepID=UPI001F51387F|nr:hypothetical protein [Streptomyces sp. CNQ085]MCI0385999.1 hypothetical protein [Streptomyces sp. CNQ085]